MTSVLILSLGLSACLAPVAPYEKSDFENTSNNLSRISIVPIAEHRGQILRTLLEQRFATVSKKRKTHNLQISMIVNNSERDFLRKRIIGEVKVTTKFTLTTNKEKGEKVVLQGNFTERSDYTVLSEFSARRDAKDEALRHVIDRVAAEITLRLRLYFFAKSVKEKNNPTNKPENIDA